MLYIGLLGMINSFIHNLLNLSNGYGMILSLHYINPAVQRQDSHFIQLIAILLCIGLPEGYQLIINEYRKLQLGSKLLLEICIDSQHPLQAFSDPPARTGALLSSSPSGNSVP